MFKPGNIYSGSEACSGSSEFTHIVAYPYSSGIEMIGSVLVPYLSIPSTISIEAAETLVDTRPDAKIVIPGETCYKGLIDTTDLMKAHARIDGVSAEAIEPLHKLPNGKFLNNTYLQTEAVANYAEEILEDDDKPEFLIVTMAYHSARVRQAVSAHRQLRDRVSFVSAEDVLHHVGIHTYDDHLVAINGLAVSERAPKLINKVDRKGRFVINPLQQILGGARHVDAIEASPGSIVLLNTTAQKELDRALGYDDLLRDSSAIAA